MANTKKMSNSQETSLPTEKKSSMIVYVGRAHEATRVGKVTGQTYRFEKKPKATKVDDKDIPALLAEKGNGCVRHAPEALFLFEDEYNTLCGAEPQ